MIKHDWNDAGLHSPYIVAGKLGVSHFAARVFVYKPTDRSPMIVVFTCRFASIFSSLKTRSRVRHRRHRRHRRLDDMNDMDDIDGIDDIDDMDDMDDIYDIDGIDR